MHAYLLDTLTWQVKTSGGLIEIHGCKAWYICQLIDNTEEGIIYAGADLKWAHFKSAAE